MAQRKFTPVQGSVSTLAHYFDLIADWADRTGTATPMLDKSVELYKRCIEMGLGDNQDIAIMVDVINSLPRKKAS